MIYYDHAASNLQRRAASSDPATGQRPPGPSRDTPGRYRAGDRQPGGDDRSSVRPRPPPADARPDGRRSFQLSMKAPVGPVSSRTEVNEPRRMASRVMIEKKHSTKFGEAFVVPTAGPEAEADRGATNGRSRQGTNDWRTWRRTDGAHRTTVRVPETLSPHATWAYSWRRSPSLSRRFD